MNRVRYRFHPGECELGENEQFYSDMEAKGWRLVKRGARLSKFTPVEPRRTRYRIEVSSPGFLEEPELSEGQLAVFEDCGWEYVTSRSFLHIFRAPEGSDAPEFYTAPAQQAETLKKVRRSLWLGWIVTLAALALAAWLITLGDRPWSKVFGEMFKRFIQTPTFYLFYGCVLFRAVCQLVWDTWKIDRTYRRLKKGIPLDHTPKRRPGWRPVDCTLAGLAILFILMLAVQILTTQSDDMPLEPDGPYITLRSLGLEGERITFMGNTGNVTHTFSLLADYWDTAEYVRSPAEEGVCWMYQDVYRLRFPGMADALARALMATPVLSYGPDAFQPVEAEGFDRVWVARLELVAVKGDMVAYIDALGAFDNTDFDYQAVCAALLEAWEG